jgi:hypothetical protein
MLVDAPLPRGSGANLAVVGTLFEGFERSVASPLQPRRLRAMGRTVQPSSPPCQTIVSTALQVAVPSVRRQCCIAHDGGDRTLRAHCKKSAEHLPLPSGNDACESLHLLTVLPTLAPIRIDAPRCTVASRFQCQPFGCGIHCQSAT